MTGRIQEFSWARMLRFPWSDAGVLPEAGFGYIPAAPGGHALSPRQPAAGSPGTLVQSRYYLFGAVLEGTTCSGDSHEISARSCRSCSLPDDDGDVGRRVPVDHEKQPPDDDAVGRSGRDRFGGDAGSFPEVDRARHPAPDLSLQRRGSRQSESGQRGLLEVAERMVGAPRAGAP